MARGNGLIYGLREQVVKQIRNDIYAGRLAAGERLSETSLTERFNISRTPIREALQQLTQEGILEAKPNCGVRVAAEISDEIQELIISIRSMIETYALRHCFADLTEEDYQRWEEIVNLMEVACRKRDYSSIAEHDLEFHRAIIHCAKTPDLEAIWGGIVGRVRSHFRNSQKRYHNLMDIHAEHAKLLEIFRSDDCNAAVEALEANIG